MSSSARTFLNVEQSLTGQTWIERANAAQLKTAEAISERHDVNPLVARVMAGRGVALDDGAEFLEPTLRALMPDPSSLTDMDAAAARIADAVERGESVAILGDYDVDGATSSALLSKALSACGVQSRIYIPDRIFEGYGPNENAITELIDDGAQLIVTVDCGTTSIDALKVAAARSVDVLVLDHHQTGAELPECHALVNPNRDDDLSGQGHLCAVGVVFLTLVALNRELRRRNWPTSARPLPDLMNWLDLVALGTICDVVPLVGLNRAYVRRGLDVMRQQTNAGLVALARAARQEGPAEAWHLGFLLGPRINAGGRVGDAGLGARLLISNDAMEAESIAAKLDELNGERQQMEAAMLEQAIAEADAEIGAGDGPAVIVTESDDWHPGVVGLLASRLKDRFRRPAFAIAFNSRGIGSGSGRSIPGVDIGKAVRGAVEAGLLVKGGGHAMAAGLTIERGQLGALRSFFEERLGQTVASERAVQELKIDGALTARGATLDLISLLDRAGPYGTGHPSPVFAFPQQTIVDAGIVGANHLRVSLRSADGSTIQGIAFRRADDALGQGVLANIGRCMHFAGSLSSNFFRGTTRVQLRLLDASPAE